MNTVPTTKDKVKTFVKRHQFKISAAGVLITMGLAYVFKASLDGKSSRYPFSGAEPGAVPIIYADYDESRSLISLSVNKERFEDSDGLLDMLQAAILAHSTPTRPVD
jgi:hypothetical protein